ncbi:MAG: glycoside hydrolase family 2 protein [Mediterranea sp.]|nr:glycoside hydrolase family 2 protein [Mediterranea sp.]
MKITKCIFLFALTLVVQTNVQAQLSFGSPQLINAGWQFCPGDNPDDKTVWQTVDLPHDWSVKQPLSPTYASCQGFLPGGIGWYRKDIHIPPAETHDDASRQKVYLYFEGVYNRSEVFVNGKSVGSRPNGYISFAFDISGYIISGGKNEILVRVDHSRDADSRWYTGSGIYRNVWLVTAGPVHIAQWGVQAVPSLNKNRGTLTVSVDIDNFTSGVVNLQVVNELFSADNKLVAKAAAKTGGLRIPSLTMKLPVKNPAVWNLETPNLYTLKTTVLQDGKIIDQTTTTTGFRTFTFDPDTGFGLNGENLKMKGVCLHHDAGALGATVPREVWKRRLQTLKEIGVNAIRTSHNPQAPDLYDLCDELGLLVLNEAYDEWEFPKNKWIAGWNVGTPGHQGTSDIFRDWGEKDLEDMVRRDRNHVSVFAWSIGNEVDYPNDPYSHPVLDGNNDGFTQKMFGGYRPDAPKAERLGDIAGKLVAAVKRYDTSRPVTAGLAGVAMSNETGYPSSLDIHGYNYTESRYVSDHKTYPARVLFGSETRHDLAAWKSVTDNRHVFGQFLWTGIDYLGESGRYPSRGFYSGLVDFAGFIKPRGYFRKALWSEKPVIYLGTYMAWGRGNRGNAQPSMDAWSDWNYSEGQNINVVCYTNAAQVQLYLNGKPVGDRKDHDEKTGIIAWEVPWQAGKLEAAGYDNSGMETARYAIETTKQPYAIKAETVISGEGERVKQVIVRIIDEDGRLVTASDNEITCLVMSRGAQLLGMEAGNNTDMGDYTDNRQRVFRGQMIVYIRTDGKSEVKVQFSSPWLQSDTVILK